MYNNMQVDVLWNNVNSRRNLTLCCTELEPVSGKPSLSEALPLSIFCTKKYDGDSELSVILNVTSS